MNSVTADADQLLYQLLYIALPKAQLIWMINSINSFVFARQSR